MTRGSVLIILAIYGMSMIQHDTTQTQPDGASMPSCVLGVAENSSVLTLTRTDDAAVVEVLRGDVANYRALFLHALSVAARLQEQLDARNRVVAELRDELRERQGVKP